jgi:hypothetical protein
VTATGFLRCNLQDNGEELIAISFQVALKKPSNVLGGWHNTYPEPPKGVSNHCGGQPS